MASVKQVKYGRHFVTYGAEDASITKYFDTATEAKAFAKSVRGLADQEVGVGLKRWEVWYRVGGRVRSKRFAKKTDADAFKRQVEDDRHKGLRHDPARGKISLQDYVTTWLSGRVIAETSREQMESRFRLHVFPTLGHLPLNAIYSDDVVAWINGIRLAPSTRRVLYNNLSAVFTGAIESRRIHDNPFTTRAVRDAKPRLATAAPDAWSRERVQCVQDALAERWRFAAVVGSRLGLRQGEVFGLSPHDVDEDAMEVHIRRQVQIVGSRLVFGPPKHGSERRVPLTRSLLAYLKAYQVLFPAEPVTLRWSDAAGRSRTAHGTQVSVTLFLTSREGGPTNRNYFNTHIWKPALTRAGVPEGRENGSHALRHHFAAVCLAAGMSVPELSKYLGHSDPAFTARVYAHLMPDARKQASEVLERMFGCVADGVGPAPSAPAT